jgi:hypothetical protein
MILQSKQTGQDTLLDGQEIRFPNQQLLDIRQTDLRSHSIDPGGFLGFDQGIDTLQVLRQGLPGKHQGFDNVPLGKYVEKYTGNIKNELLSGAKESMTGRFLKKFGGSYLVNQPTTGEQGHGQNEIAGNDILPEKSRLPVPVGGNEPLSIEVMGISTHSAKPGQPRPESLFPSGLRSLGIPGSRRDFRIIRECHLDGPW